IPLVAHADERGSLTEIFRKSWDARAEPLQWNLLVSNARVLRGMKMHPVHTDVVVLVTGRALLVLRDFRHDSPTFRATESMAMEAGADAFVIPPGVGHAFYFFAASALLVGVSNYWDVDDELGCQWSDIDVDWPDREPLVSPNDLAQPSAEALEQFTASRSFMS
ncbi:MAG TPA: dTDP-4-dehydrorhamnose 3,5-epimerase family protein, partial [Thermoanaerobaculia bacterium]|nr:dTDP-4-dehydrorhamnose 3,5-epimerase family protein [Thermoanaerobaculia bacterium]